MVVGYAGLLDLGYVAFYALGAYTAAWLASPHASQFTLGGKPIDVNIGGIGVTEGLGGIHISIWVVLLAAAIVTAVGGILIGLPTLRLRGDYLAIVTLGFGEIIAEVARNGDSETLGFNLTDGPPGINPIDPPGFGVWLSDHLGLPANYIDEIRPVRELRQPLLLVGDRAPSDHDLLQHQDARLDGSAARGSPSARTRSPQRRWGSRSCGRRPGPTPPARSSAAWPVPGSARSSRASSRTTSTSVSRSSSSRMVILGGMGNVWGVVAGAALLTYLNQEGLSSMSAWFNDKVLPM